MEPNEADSFGDVRAAYIHVPFCSAVCPYCDFAVVAGADHMAERYIQAVLGEISMSDPMGSLGSVYFGGGTPSHIDPALLGRVLDALARRHGLDADAEISVEANPEDFSPGRAGAIQALGFNRVSFGAQSFDGAVLNSLGRRHGDADIRAAVEAARLAGYSSVSLDLIFGTPGETEGSWASTLEQGVALEPEHISCYALTVEPGTPLGRSVRQGAAAPDPDVQADRYEYAEETLADSGYLRYEVSNWAKPGYECRYNLTVWAQGEYEAYGNGAHRFREAVRSRNIRRLEAYMDRVESGIRPTAGTDPVEGWDREIDRLFVGLRRSAGVSPGPGGDALMKTGEGSRLNAAGVIGLIDGRLVVKRPLLTDEVHRSVLDLPVPEDWGKPPRPR